MPLTEKVLLSAFLGTLQINSQVFTCRNLTFFSHIQNLAIFKNENGRSHDESGHCYVYRGG